MAVHMFKKLEEILNINREIEDIKDVQIKVLDVKMMSGVKNALCGNNQLIRHRLVGLKHSIEIPKMKQREMIE